MKRYALATLIALALPAVAPPQGEQPAPPGGAPLEKSTTTTSTQRGIVIQHVRPGDRRGINMFEPPKDDETPFTGFRVDFGAAFTQQFQSLDHSNTASVLNKTDAAGKTYNANQLMNIGSGFNNAVANASLDVQLAPGIRVAVTSYLSARRH